MTKDDAKKTSKKPPNNVRTEAELESRLAAAITQAFPNIGRDQLVEQRRFTIRLGHSTHTFDSDALWEKTGRADILLFHGTRPLAVLEVKREDLPLTVDDYDQAQSYANQLTPRPPLVIVSNGVETQVYDANTGTTLEIGNDAQADVCQLLANAAKVAVADMRWAIEALMGRETEVWTQAVRGCTARLIAELTDPPGEHGRPFAENLLFPRIATHQVMELLKEEKTFTIVEGFPVSGKSSLLRELALKTRSSEELAVLMLRGDGPGLYRAVANLFEAELNWTLSDDDARSWLRRMSKEGAGPTLVVAIDDLLLGSAMAMDMAELASMPTGPQLKILVTTDRAVALTRAPNGRTPSALGNRAASVTLDSMRIKEFQTAARYSRSKGSVSPEAPSMLRTSAHLGTAVDLRCRCPRPPVLGPYDSTAASARIGPRVDRRGAQGLPRSARPVARLSRLGALRACRR